MNTLSKTFVVLNLLFAVTFCALTMGLYAKKVNYREQAEITQKKLDDATTEFKAEIANLNEKNTELASAIKVQAETMEGVKNELEQNQEDLLRKETDTANIQQERDIVMTRNVAQGEELMRSNNQIDRMHRIILTQQKAVEVAKENMRNAHSRSIALENNFNNLRQQHIALQKEKERLEKDLAQQTYILESLAERGIDPTNYIGDNRTQPPSPLYGKVVAVRDDLQMVMLSIGSEEQVKKGYRFTVYHGDEYIGKVVVEMVYPDMCTARILTDVTTKPIKENYDASTGPIGL